MLPIDNNENNNLKLINSSVSNCSSESEHYKSNNVLLEDTYRVWQTKDKTDKAFIELQFPTPTQIKQIEITNAGSAFIEVLVGLVTWESTEFQVLVPLTNFMTFSESTNKVNRNKTKVFDSKQFSQQTIPRKWERVRIVCTQPWSVDNLGIASIKVYGPNKKQSSNLNRSSLQEPNDISLTDTSLNNTNDNNNEENKTNTSIETEVTAFKSEATQVLDFIPTELTKSNSSIPKQNRQATLALNNPLPGQVLVINKKQKSSIVNNENSVNNNNNKEFNLNISGGTDISMEVDKHNNEIETEEENEEEKNNRIDKSIKQKSNINNNNNNNKNKENIVQNNNVNINNNNDGDTDEEVIVHQVISTPKNHKKLTAFGNLLKGVVLVIGGIINPEKSELRDKALEMGADYKPDWCREATHLVTPFNNTPKFREAKKSGGSIVKPSWIEDCYKTKSRLPIGSYTFRSESIQNDSEDDIMKKIDNSKKIGKSISTTDKKRKRKGAPTSDDSEDDSHIPNEYDYNDGFIDNSYSSSEAEEKDPDDIRFDKENVNDLLKDGLDYLERTYHYKPKSEIHHNTHHKKHKYQNNDSDDDSLYKKSSSYKPNKYYNEEYDTTAQQQSQQQQHIKQTDQQSASASSSSNSSPPIKYKPKPQKAEPFDDDLLFERSNTIQMTPEEVKNELNRIKSLNTSNDRNKDQVMGGDTDEDIDEKPSKYNGKGDNKDLKSTINNFNNNNNKNSDNNDDKNIIQTDIKGKEYILKPLPSFFDGFEFYLSLKDESLRKNISRLIIAYKGIISTKPTSNTKFIITDRNWDRTFDITKKNFPNILFLNPSFVMQSHNYQKLSTVDKHIVAKAIST